VPSLLSFIERGFVLDTIEVAVEWDRIHTLYSEVCAALRTVKGVIVASATARTACGMGDQHLLHLRRAAGRSRAAEPTYLACWEQAMEATLRVGGTISHHHGIGRMRTRWMAPSTARGWRCCAR